MKKVIKGFRCIKDYPGVQQGAEAVKLDVDLKDDNGRGLYRIHDSINYKLSSFKEDFFIINYEFWEPIYEEVWPERFTDTGVSKLELDHLDAMSEDISSMFEHDGNYHNSIIAFIKLMRVYKCYNVPNLDVEDDKWIIIYNQNDLMITHVKYSQYSPFVFDTSEKAEHFMNHQGGLLRIFFMVH
jgi:hypothetical protein